MVSYYFRELGIRDVGERTVNVNTADATSGASALLLPAIRVPECPVCVAVSQHPRLPPVSFYGRASTAQYASCFYIVHCIWGWAVGVWSPLSRPQGSVVSGVVAWSCVCVSGSGWL